MRAQATASGRRRRPRRDRRSRRLAAPVGGSPWEGAAADGSLERPVGADSASALPAPPWHKASDVTAPPGRSDACRHKSWAAPAPARRQARPLNGAGAPPRHADSSLLAPCSRAPPARWVQEPVQTSIPLGVAERAPAARASPAPRPHCSQRVRAHEVVQQVACTRHPSVLQSHHLHRVATGRLRERSEVPSSNRNKNKTIGLTAGNRAELVPPSTASRC